MKHLTYIFSVFLLTSCNGSMIGHTITALEKKNQEIIASAKFPIIYSCSQYFQWPGFPLATTASASIIMTKEGKLNDAFAQWQMPYLPQTIKDPVIVGKTKFLSVNSTAYWRSDHLPGPAFALGRGLLNFNMEAFPWRPHARLNSLVEVYRPDGLKVPLWSFSPLNVSIPRFSKRPSTTTGTATILWKDVQSLGLEKTGIILRMAVDGEGEPRTYLVASKIINEIGPKVSSLMASAESDSSDYKSKCHAGEQIPMTN